MSTISVSSIDAFTAHREWATRPSDERFESVASLYEAALSRRNRVQEHVMSTRDLRVETDSTERLFLRIADSQPLALNHWSFGQLAAIARAPAQYLRTLPPSLAAPALNHGLGQRERNRYQIYRDRDAPYRALAVTSPRYTRIHHDELAARLLDLMSRHPEWQLPLGYKDGVEGADQVPSGAYMGDRDMFVFMLDTDRSLDDPTDVTGQGLRRGFILRNSDVGAAALSLDLFLCRMTCGNHVFWEFQQLASFRRRHVGVSVRSSWNIYLGDVARALDADTSSDRTVLRRAIEHELGKSKEDVLEAVTRRFDLPKSEAKAAYDLAERYEPNPRSVWGFVQGLTRLSQQTAWQDQRFLRDRAAGRLLATVS